MDARKWFKVKVTCPGCGWKGRRDDPRAHHWRNHEVPTCPKCGFHPVKYHRTKEKNWA